MTTTVFGKKVRELRVRRNVLLKEMADGIGVSPSFASGMESGARNVTVTYARQVATYFGLSGPQTDELIQLATDSRNRVSIELRGASMSKRGLAIAFARRFPALSDEEVVKLFEDLEAGSS